MKPFKIPLMLLAAVSLSGCQYDILHTSGWVAGQERNLLIISTLLMLIVIIPVLFLTAYFPWKYRANRTDTSDYEPEFEHSTKLEYVIWGVPILIVAALGYVTYVYTHRLDPYKPLDHIAAEPVEVEAVSLDWKWLFIYPQYGVASVNELAIPAGRPINFKLTSATVMNTLSIPALSGMIYSMSGMQTKIHMVADKPGVYEGRSAHYSGPGFSKMTFKTLAMEEPDFDTWVQKVRDAGTPLNGDSYAALEVPSIGTPVTYYSGVQDGLFDRIRDLCVEKGKVCLSDMMMQDKMGGGGLEGIANKKAYEYDSERAIDGFGNAIKQPGEVYNEAAPADHSADQTMDHSMSHKMDTAAAETAPAMEHEKHVD